MITQQDALDYHSKGRPGKIEVIATKPCLTQMDLSLAYTPGVAVPCREIEKDPSLVFKYTAKGNLVAVVSNGTAVLGLGDIGPMAGKPVMEGKGVLFKRFSDVDVFDIELDTKDPEEIIRIVKALEPTFGGINLEDIKAPECFEIESRLVEIMDIPVFHDDQHGTAIITCAGLINALELAGKTFESIKVVFSGAGAAAIAIANLMMEFGVRKENMIVCDSKGVIYKGRKEGMNPYKEKFAADTPLRTLEEAMKGADVFIGVSVAGMVTKDMVRSMADNPIVFAMANPDPEISYPDALEARDDVIMATGRSDYPNQVNNVLGFPFIFRGALDVHARKINTEMKMAAARALAALAKEDVPEGVCKAYGVERITFGREYIIPKPLDPRVLLWEAPAVAQAAMDTGVARHPIEDMDAYKERLERLINPASRVTNAIVQKAKKGPRKVVFPEGTEEKIVRAARIMVKQGICHPILLGNKEKVLELMNAHGLKTTHVDVVDPAASELFESYVAELYEMRKRKGMTLAKAREEMLRPNVFGAMMVHTGKADGMVSGLTSNYPDTIRPALQIVGIKEGVRKVSGLYMLIMKKDIYFFADTTVNPEPDAEDLAEIAIGAADMAKCFDVEPRVAMLSFSNFGSTRHPLSYKVQKAVEIAKARRPDLVLDGEMQADTATNQEILDGYPFCALKKEANVLIFPNLEAGNIAYKLMIQLGRALPIGPLLVGMRKPVNVLQMGASVSDIVDVAAITVIEAQADGCR